MDSFQKAEFIVRLVQEKKAHDVLIMDMRKVMDLTDFFILCSAESNRQVKTIADYLLENMKKRGFDIWHIEGYEDGKWILLDYGDAIIHIFMEEVRRFYELERLWRDVPIRSYDSQE